MSTATKGLLEKALKLKKIAASAERLSRDTVPLAAFNWSPHGHKLSERDAAAGSKAGADQAFTGLLEHFWAHLPDDLKRRGSLINAEGASLKYLVADEANGSVLLRGSPDASFAHSNAVVDDAALSLCLSCLLIDWKTPKAMRSDAAGVRAQVAFQLLAFYSEFGRAIPIVATDCATSIRVWSLQGRRLVEHLGPAGDALSLSEGMGVVCALLPASIDETEAYLRSLDSPLELDDESGGSSEGEGPDEGPDEEGPDEDRGGGFAGGGGGGGAGGGGGESGAGAGSSAAGAGSRAAGGGGGAADGESLPAGPAPRLGRSRSALSALPQAEANLYADLDAERKKQSLRALLRRVSGMEYLSECV